MRLMIISGRSGSGKSTCLHVLEDLGFYCVDNIPASLLEALSIRLNPEHGSKLKNVAVSIDARNISEDLQQFPHIFERLQTNSIDKQIIFLDAATPTLVKRFSETRRKHPLSNDQIGLLEAIKREKVLLEPIASLAHLMIDTSDLSLHQLRDMIKNRVAKNECPGLALQFQSFGFKNGVPVDVDMIYDARCLPNPYWINSLRPLTGLDQAVINYLDSQEQVQEMLDDIKQYLERWLPRFEANNRSYITVAIGCTGGQHRSVYLCEKLKEHFSKSLVNVQVRHKEFA
jgi:RNase adapter protein RapZ